MYLLCILLVASIAGCSRDAHENNDLPNTELENPMVEYDTVAEAKKAAGFDFDLLGNIPKSFKPDKIYVIDNKIIQLDYMEGNNKITFRAAKGKGDISGDYNKYPQQGTVEIKGTEIKVKGKGDKIYVATWYKDGISYSLTASEGINKKLVNILR